jgi:hypothetical protein
MTKISEEGHAFLLSLAGGYKEMSSIFADESKCGGRGGMAGSQPVSTAEQITWHGAQINLEDLPPYLTYGRWDLPPPHPPPPTSTYHTHTEKIFFRRNFLSAIFKPTRRKPGHSPDPARPVSDFGTKAAPLLGSWNRGRDVVYVSYRNVTAALSLLNKVCNSIKSKRKGKEANMAMV